MPTNVPKKRKASSAAEPKFYGVKAGKVPGVYTLWSDCQEMITGFKGASYKSFPSKKEAEDFVAGKVVAGTSKGAPTKFYGVAVGHHPGVYTEWTEAQEQITNVKGPKYKKFESRAEAEAFVESGGKVKKLEKEEVVLEDGERERKKVKTTATPKTGSKGGYLKVWTDGSSRGNGKKNAEAGVGVYFGYDDERNLAERLAGDPQTNQRAELTGILRALELVPPTQNLEIITDSNYGINCVSVWYENWTKRGWVTSTGGPVVNRDLVEKIREKIDERDGKGTKTLFTWVKGHSEDEGNIGADLLAVQGSRLPEVIQ